MDDNKMNQPDSPAGERTADEVAALSAVVRALQALPSLSVTRVLSAAAAFFGVQANAVPNAKQPDATGRLGSHTGSGPFFSADRTPSPKEFLFEKKPATDVERIACLAYYLTHYRETPHFKTLDLSKLNTEAAQLKLSNAAHAADNATRAGFLVPATKGSKQLSVIGEQYVQALPDRTAAKAAVANARPKRKSRRGLKGGSSGGDSFVADMEER